ncbi:NADH:flavin oxidoreductase/NADH oxidase [Desulfopila inferna]|uniref:NADH:flavin oxidoreductase/NADH oxidase n=1 Tax=Desulfopila inferna TaxID=468528 RepID=UPI00196467B6|nr:NADH:flavin oxidoreductase/NADH oxidase [Desulfopila inferna]MBM9604953.1 NADH:flavin oxidoreductase/NADH oxidase [Desulfopila inferna]
MAKSRIFESFSLKGVTFKNRIAMAPMCQYSAGNDGLVNDWHFIHYAARAIGQAGLIIVEATAVESRGRISNRDLGIWSDAAIEPFNKLIRQVKKHGCKIGIQIAHAGRKATIVDEPIVAPSAIPFNDTLQVPVELSTSEIDSVIHNFASSARRAVAAGVDFIEIHAAHGYLINQFLSPLTNVRKDEFGTDKSLFLKMILEEVVKSIPDQMPVFIRVSAEEYMEGGNHPEDLCRLLEPVKHFIDLVHVSSGGVIENAAVESYPGYQLHFADILRQQLKLPVMAVGMLESPAFAEEALQNNKADFIALGREFLRNPFWPLHAASHLSEDIEWPEQYARAKL